MDGPDSIAHSEARRRGAARVVLAYVAAIAGALVTAWWLSVRHPDLHPIWVVAIADVVATLVVFGFSVVYRNSSFYDPYWSVAPPIIAATFALVPEAAGGDRMRLLAVYTLIAFWAVRLTWNWARSWQGLSHEDWRYVDFQAKTGRAYWLVSFSGIHLFPTVIVFVACLPLYYALVSPASFGWLDALATGVTLTGVLFELFADNQLRRFVQSKPAPGATLDTGLWAWSRHPNYFGEMSFWWGLWLFAMAADAAAWWTAIGPLAITIMFLFASLPMIETRMAARRVGWDDYVKRVPLVVPWPPKSRG